MTALARAVAVLALAALASATVATASGRARLDVAVPGVDRVDLVRETSGGALVYDVRYADGRTERLDPEAFAERLYRSRAERPLWRRVLNVDSAAGIAWVALGLLGQVLFACRMLVQWIASEKSQRSVVPVAFWWISLGGATMLLVYFAWRRDIVGILGQATGWLIYLRNLVLIYRGSARTS
jgi:lipid-A-disaccharide synthase-like uncharacterized protein